MPSGTRSRLLGRPEALRTAFWLRVDPCRPEKKASRYPSSLAASFRPSASASSFPNFAKDSLWGTKRPKNMLVRNDGMAEWRDIPGWHGRYRVSDDGQIMSLQPGRQPKLLRIDLQRSGHHVVSSHIWRIQNGEVWHEQA
jgi:NUMOD4 motif